MKRTLFILSALLLLVVSSCNINCIDKSGPVITDNRELESFSKIKIDIPADVKIVVGRENHISIKAAESYVNAISTDIKRGKLYILGDVCKADNHDIQIEISTQSLEKLKVSGSADVYSETPVNNDDIDLIIDGSGSISLNLFSKYCEGEIHGSGVINLKGTAQKLGVLVDGSGEFKGLGLNTYNSKVHIKGSGKAGVVAHDKLVANVDGSGEINYSGNPEISINIKGSGKVNKIN